MVAETCRLRPVLFEQGPRCMRFGLCAIGDHRYSFSEIRFVESYELKLNRPMSTIKAGVTPGAHLKGRSPTGVCPGNGQVFDPAQNNTSGSKRQIKNDGSWQAQRCAEFLSAKPCAPLEETHGLAEVRTHGWA